MKIRIASLLASVAAGSVLASPAAAQHARHSPAEPQQSAEAQADAKTKCEQEADRHRAMGHPVADGACEPAAQSEAAMDHSEMDHMAMDHGSMPQGKPAEGGMDQSQMNHGEMGQAEAASSSMDHGQMDHSQMNHGRTPSQDMQGMDHSAMQMGSDADIPLLPPPPEAGSGPARAAVAIWGEEAMNEARRELVRETDGGMRFWFQGDRLEYRAREGKEGYLWDIQGYYGGDIDKFWFKSEGEGSFGEPIEDAEVQALWSRAIAPFFDFQAGVRQDLTGPERTHAVIGIQGIAPYQFEVDVAAFVSNKGDVTARFEGELDQRITQRLILQPRAEIALSAQDIPELGIGAGLDRIEAGLRLRYEFAREFAPYVGVSQEWRIGQSADFARAAGEDPSVTNYVVGLRFWF
ncbi:copper resistance protein B [Pelagerythrobacter aerophilus]|uniref:Copper resistance protein B n=1 Tax=Pelagerythrobacter aerophilus TaxID=2306995 RepID=A0A418NME3_9SPHN|nr:copper resistance protein B [Pelagerythrobacter aerophilus]RIV81687.1 copper resistance protein B [Pelagerythrobacter aerophilus]